MKKIIIVTIIVTSYTVSAQFGGIKLPKRKTEKTDENKTSANTTTSNEKLTYDKDGYIIDDPTISEYLESKNKLHVTAFGDPSYNPKFKDSQAPSDYSYLDIAKFNDGTKIVDITFVNRVKTPNSQIREGTILYSYRRLECIDGNNLFGDPHKILEIQANGDVLFFTIKDKKVDQVFYLSQTKAQSVSASNDYKSYVAKAELGFKKATTLLEKENKEKAIKYGSEAYEKYKAGNKNLALEASLIKIANKNTNVNTQHGNLTFKSIRFIDTDWEISKNDLGKPLDMQVECYGVGKYADGSGFIQQLEFKKDYMGGGKYSDKIDLFSDHSDFPIDANLVK